MPSPVVREMLDRMPAKRGLVAGDNAFAVYDLTDFPKSTIHEFVDEWRRLIARGVVVVYWLTGNGVQFIIATAPSVSATNDRG
jgi:hypothetical protein